MEFSMWGETKYLLNYNDVSGTRILPGAGSREIHGKYLTKRGLTKQKKLTTE